MAPLLLATSFLAFLGRSAPSCRVARRAPPSLAPRLRGAAPPLVRRLVGPSLPLALQLLAAPLSPMIWLAGAPRPFVRMLVWASLPPLSIRVVVLSLALPLAGLRCSLCPDSWAHTPLVRLLAGAVLPTALPLVMAALLCVLSSLAVALPLSTLLVGLRYLWFRPVCVLTTLVAADLAPILFESTLVLECWLYAKAPWSLTLNNRSPSCSSASGRPRTKVP